MAQRMIKATMAMIAVTLLFIGASSDQEDCTSAIISLAPCIDYITGSSSAPTVQCCTQFATVVNSEPMCLCIIINGGGSQFGIKVNQTRALALPGECGVQTPPVSRCNAVVPSPSVPPPSGGNSNGGNSAGSFLKPTFLPVVISAVTIVMAYLTMSPMIF